MSEPRARALIAKRGHVLRRFVYRSTSKGRQVDVSHRGGKAGFVRIGEDGVMTMPDFAGNLFFATLGNFI